jgi:serine/threonine protein kinase
MHEVKAFLRGILACRLVEREKLLAQVSSLPADRRRDPQQVADHLVHAGLLTSFQAMRLLKGGPSGLVFGPYRLQEPIGKGGMARVFLARDTEREQLVALKVLPPSRVRADARYLARFLREKELVERLAHPHIACKVDAGVISQVHYLALEYVPGRSLYRLVKADGPLPFKTAARLFVQVADAIEYAHGRSLVHRDLKPSNIMVTPDGQAKVLDFGLALVMGELELVEVVGGRGYAVGTMDYISPEQATDSYLVDERSDLYSLGCTLYFALTGGPPFPAGSKREKIQLHLTAEPRPVTELAPHVPADFAALVGTLMAKNPQDRLPSARVLREVLMDWIEENPWRGMRAG